MIADKLRQSVEEIVANVIAAQATGLPEGEPLIVPEEVVQQEQAKTIEFDEEDSLRVSNYLLRIQNERSLREIEAHRSKFAALELDLADREVHKRVAQKYGLDLNSYILEIDAKQRVFRVDLKP